MKTLVIVSLILMVLLTIGGVAYAKKKGLCTGPEARAEWMLEKVSRRLDLDEQQRGKLVALRDSLLATREDFVEARAQGRAAVVELLAESTLDRQRAEALLEDRQALVSSNGQGLIAAFADFSDSLNDEQRGQMIDWLNQRRHDGFGHRYGHWRM